MEGIQHFALASPDMKDESGSDSSPQKKSSTPSIKHGLNARAIKSSVTDHPELVQLCHHYLQTKNVGGLAMVARQRGLPPAMRAKAWPVLLRYHPFVLNPYITPDIEVEVEDEENEREEDVHVSRIRTDLHKYLKSSSRSPTAPAAGLSPELKELFSTQDEIFCTLEHAIVKFMRKWGSIINYDSGLTWVALGLAEWIPPLPDSNYVLCGRFDKAKNGTKLRNLLDDFFERLPEDQLQSVMSTPSVPASPKSSSSDEEFALPESGYPQPSPLSGINSPFVEYPYKTMTFAEVYERMVLVILHSPETEEAADAAKQTEESLMNTLPIRGGTANERISLFLYCLRTCLPELNQFLSEEDILNTNSTKDDWLMWWIKWCGAKAWSRYDRGRVWDMLLGWRDSKSFPQEDIDRLGLTQHIGDLLGPDVFWNPLSNNSSTFRPSLKPLITSLSSTNLLNMNSARKSVSSASLPASTEVTPPVSILDPHFELIFVSVAFLKSKEFALLELEQSEIREFLNKASSQSSGPNFQRVMESDIKARLSKGLEKDSTASPSLNESLDASSFYHHSNFIHRKSSRDIENVIYEAGEIWRKWLWQETVENNSLS